MNLIHSLVLACCDHFSVGMFSLWNYGRCFFSEVRPLSKAEGCAGRGRWVTGVVQLFGSASSGASWDGALESLILHTRRLCICFLTRFHSCSACVRDPHQRTQGLSAVMYCLLFHSVWTCFFSFSIETDDEIRLRLWFIFSKDSLADMDLGHLFRSSLEEKKTL